MRLFYDILVPYLPDGSCREAMIELSKFQTSQNVSCLFKSVLNACDYANCNAIDTILNITNYPDFPDGTSVDNMLDTAAKLLFQSVKPNATFNIDTFVANVLTAAHVMLIHMSIAAPTKQPETDNKNK